MNTEKLQAIEDSFIEKFISQYKSLNIFKVFEFRMEINEELSESEWNKLFYKVVRRLNLDYNLFSAVRTNEKPLLKLVVSEDVNDLQEYANKYPETE